MGKNNKARRAAKAKQRRSSSGGPAPPGNPFGPFGTAGLPGPSPRERVVDELIRIEKLAARGRSKSDVEAAARAASRRLASVSLTVIDDIVEQMLASHIGGLWAAGWQPAELRREVQRSAPAPGARLVELAILHDATKQSGPVDPRWSAQLAEFALRPISSRSGLLRAWRDQETLEVEEAHWHVLMVVRALVPLPQLDVLIPPPGTKPGATSVAGEPLAAGQAEDPVLRRVRKLLSKAESTPYEHEAEALTAKAHELMVRHAIDQATLDVPGLQGPVLARIPVDAPYSDAKSVLLSEIAGAYRCLSVQYKTLAMCALVGHAGDLRIVELLFVSLLVQAQNALNFASKSGAQGRARSQAFRSSFYVAYAHRIGERLATVEQQVFIDAGEAGRSALPVLRDREQAVTDAFDERFGDTLVSSPIRGGYDIHGAATGRRAADEAALDSGALLW